MKTYTLIIISVLFGLNYHVHSQEVTHNKDKKTETTRSKEERKAEHAEIRDKKELDNHRSKQEQVNQSQSDAKSE
ncbi:MAG: hypothetical protein PF590_08555 [Candidatus Delongbacteria bacterium]|nr:hypothetical protein [Candidatus Delongbacteria bacterium]